MPLNTTSVALLFAVTGAAAFAFLHNDTATASAPAVTAPAPQVEAPVADREQDPPLPPNHPAIGGKGAGVAPSEARAAITWKAPAAWPSAPNPSSMRIATHTIPHSLADHENAELSVTRAGGDVDANLQRWVDQFGGAAGEKRRERTIHGLRVAIVEVEGTYEGGMGAASGSHPGWALLGAIVVTPEQPTFFKLTGPVATVHAARAAFEALLDSVTPVL